MYHQPGWEELIKDVVYQGFVQPAYQAERKRADQIEQDLLREQQQLYQIKQALAQEKDRAAQAEQAAGNSKANTLTLLRQIVALRFNLTLDYYDHALSTLDH